MDLAAPELATPPDVQVVALDQEVFERARRRGPEVLARLEHDLRARLPAEQAPGSVLDALAGATHSHAGPEVRQAELSSRHGYRHSRGRLQREEVHARIAAVDVNVGADVRLEEA